MGCSCLGCKRSRVQIPAARPDPLSCLDEALRFVTNSTTTESRLCHGLNRNVSAGRYRRQRRRTTRVHRIEPKSLGSCIPFTRFTGREFERHPPTRCPRLAR